jgi:single-strand DNA-binding protein
VGDVNEPDVGADITPIDDGDIPFWPVKLISSI